MVKQPPSFSITGDEGDISNLCQFKWYEWVYYREGSANFPLPREVLGRSLGPAKGEGNEMAQWCLKANGNVVPRRSVRPLTDIELSSETEQAKRSVFNDLIKARWGTSVSPPPAETPKDDADLEPYEDDDEQPFALPDFDDPVDATGRAIDSQPAYDKLINVELMLPQNGEYQPAIVTGRTIGPSGRPEGIYDPISQFNTYMYDVRFPDGDVKEYTANTISENLMNQIDHDGFSTTTLRCIVDHRSDDQALTHDNMYTTNAQGVKRMRKTTCGWQLLVQWHDGAKQWIPLSVLKESNPVDIAEYVTARGIDKEPAFAWWVPYTLRKRDAIVASISVRARKTTHKYGIEVPTCVAHAHALDKRNGNTLWDTALKKEMHNVGIAFEILEPPRTVPPGWSKASGHIIFDVRKARWVLDGHLTPDADYSTYAAGVVS
jgi:hypothetical protein